MVLSNHSHPVTNEQQMNQIETSDLGAITQTNAGRIVFHALSKRERFRRTTDLNRLYRFIVDKVDADLSEESFLMVFKRLSEMKLGKLIIGRKNNPNRFRWFYNLREAASAALDNKPLSDLATLPRKPRIVTKKKTKKQRRGRKPSILSVKPTFKNYEAQVSKPMETAPIEAIKPGIVININVPPGTSPEDVKALVDLAKTLGT